MVENELFQSHLQMIYKLDISKAVELAVTYFESNEYYETESPNAIRELLRVQGIHSLWEYRSPLFVSKCGDAEKEEEEMEQKNVQVAIDAVKSDMSQLNSAFSAGFRVSNMVSVAIQKAKLKTNTSVLAPPYAGYLWILKNTTHKLRSSWNKRWFYLDSSAGELLYSKKRIWKTTTDFIPIVAIRSVCALNDTDFQIDYNTHDSLLLRAKSKHETINWIKYIEYGRIDTYRQLKHNVILPAQYTPKAA